MVAKMKNRVVEQAGFCICVSWGSTVLCSDMVILLNIRDGIQSVGIHLQIIICYQEVLVMNQTAEEFFTQIMVCV